VLSISERRACAALGQHRSTQRKIPRGRDDEEQLTAEIVELARQYGRYGYRKVAELLRRAGWLVNDKRVERIWRREGLKVPARQLTGRMCVAPTHLPAWETENDINEKDPGVDCGGCEHNITYSRDSGCHGR
jgi:transposase InsO family protein